MLAKSRHHVIIVGAGIAGLTAAFALAARGIPVTLLERAATPGGKMRTLDTGHAPVDAGPTVFTMRWVFEELFAQAGEALSDHIHLTRLDILARHAWSVHERLDLFADEDRSADAIGDFAGRAEAQRYRRFCAETKTIYDILEKPFLRADAPRMSELLLSNGWRGLASLPRIKPFTSMWRALGSYFHDPRLRQLFGRYATYCGSSPYRAPATLMLVAHVEREGVWSVEGGMHALAQALALCARKHGASICYGAEVREILLANRRASGVVLTDGERLMADAVIVNADVAAVGSGAFGTPAARATPTVPLAARSLSAITWALSAKTGGFPLSRHNVFFSRDYRTEFDAIFHRQTLPHEPTVYVCAQDRNDMAQSIEGPERLLVLVNAPPIGDTHRFEGREVEQCAQRTFEALARCGLHIQRQTAVEHVTTPTEFHQLFPATGGALYGRNAHGWTASFRRPGVSSQIPGLYLASGSTHPGPGVPMAALAGRAAAARLLADFASTARSRTVAMPGGMSTR